MTEQELRDEFESKRKGDDFSTILLCGQKAYWNKTIQRDWEIFKDGHSLAQETIEKQKKEIEHVNKKLEHLESFTGVHISDSFSFSGCELVDQIKAKDAEIERLNQNIEMVTSSLAKAINNGHVKDKVIAEARENISKFLESSEYLNDWIEHEEKAKVWLENNK